jgi:uncharacterized protein (TIGR03118 family)
MKTRRSGDNCFGKTALALLLGLSVGGSISSVPAAGGSNSGGGGYTQSNLVSDQPGMARFVDANLVNPWGILVLSGGLPIVADNHAGVSTIYDVDGRPISVRIAVPAPDGSPGGAVTDLAMNRFAHSFAVTNGKHQGEANLLFVTEDGTIAGWNPRVSGLSAVIAVDNSEFGAIYKGMALGGSPIRPLLYAANFGQGVVEMYDGGFHRVKSFTDPALADAGYVPFGIRNIDGHLLVTFAFKASPDDDDETAGPGLGFVDEFDADGTLLRRVASNGPLNAPWGLAMAPSNFGQFSGALLVGNFGDGTINAYNPLNGNFLGQLSDSHGGIIHIEGLWGLAFEPNGRSLYFTAGPNDENNGLMGILRAGSGG